MPTFPVAINAVRSTVIPPRSYVTVCLINILSYYAFHYTGAIQRFDRVHGTVAPGNAQGGT